jgi:hypothetical protein
MEGKIISGIAGGLIVAVLGGMLAVILSGGSAGPDSDIPRYVFMGLWIASTLIAVMASRPAKVWRRLLITSALLAFALPLSAWVVSDQTVVTTAQGAGHTTTDAAAVIAGAAAGSGIATAASGIPGLFLGVILLVTGLLTGRDKQTVVRSGEQRQEKRG